MTDSRNASAGATLETVRRFLAVIFVFTGVGTVAELVLLEHTEGFWQWTPFIFIGLSTIAFATMVVRPSRLLVRSTQGLMVAVVANGGLGVFFHLKGNVEFEKEMYPAMAGFELVWESLKGATPSLAPGAMAVLGLIGLVYCFHHPVLRVVNPP